MPTYQPDFKQFAALHGRGERVPVQRELLMDQDTPVSAFLKVADGPCAFLLESMEGGEKWGRYSILSGEAPLVFESRGGAARLIRNGVVEERPAAEPLQLLAELLRERRVAEVPGHTRFDAGAVGYLAYDQVRRFEHLPAGGPDDLGLPDAHFLFSDCVTIFDNLTHTVKVVAVAPGDGPAAAAYRSARDRIEREVARLRGPAPAETAHARGGRVAFESNVGRERYLKAVERAREYIRAGDVIQVVLSHRLSAAVKARPFDVYRALRVLNPSPYMYYLRLPGLELVGSSPEVLVRVEGREVEVRPIAGTRPRGRTPAEDAALEAELVHDEKERAEHVMLVDLGRNDVGRVSEYGSVTTPEFMVVERYSQVMHLVSGVRGRLRADIPTMDVVRACFPAGTVSGAPKIRAMEIIDELEPVRRGVYGGAVGYFGFRGNFDLCIAIRTALFAKGRAHVGVGAGIVADSVPASEWQETLHKARALVRAVEWAEAGWDGGPPTDGGPR
ncbi:MAG TPA: anthranilate synthase component I [Candidatus Saccharimonadales bacterium]|nr:anthranilate synthase component I [Candidatus Saccharimonadales bacterium]